MTTAIREQPSSIYGPVNSWRMGRSLGVDPICIDSICSFACVYCQLGKINRLTLTRETFVSTERIIEDLNRSHWENVEVITFSGSGEPTLAANLGEAIEAIRELTHKPIAVITNSTLLFCEDVRKDVSKSDLIYCKLDAWTDDQLRRIDRPVSDITLSSIVNGIKQLRLEYSGFLALQTMLLSVPDEADLKTLTEIYRQLKPDEIELNLPLRPIPETWKIESRGNSGVPEVATRHLRSISDAELRAVADRVRINTGLHVTTPYDRSTQ